MVKFKKPRLPHPKVNLSNNRLIAVLMTATTLIIAISIVLSKTWLGDIGFNNKVIKQKNQVKDTLEQNVAAIPRLQENFKNLEDNGPYVFDVLRALPTAVDYATLSSELEAAAAIASVRISAVTPQQTAEAVPTVTGAIPQPVAFQLSGTGSFKAIQKFIGNLESARRPIVLSTLSFNGSEPAVGFSATFTTYWQPVSVIGEETEELRED